jgi:hypothetical protein
MLCQQLAKLTIFHFSACTSSMSSAFSWSPYQLYLTERVNHIDTIVPTTACPSLYAGEMSLEDAADEKLPSIANMLQEPQTAKALCNKDSSRLLLHLLLYWMWLDQEEDVKEAEGCCIKRATESDYIHNRDE